MYKLRTEIWKMYRNYVYVKIMATGSKEIGNVYLYVVATVLAYGAK
jgi:hypothetical protein